MENRKGVKISLLICLSIMLIITFMLIIIIIIVLTANDKLEQSGKIILIATCVGGAIDIVILILGIASISRDHYRGSIAFTIYQLISVIFVVFNLILSFGNQSIIALLIKITILALCIIYVRQLKQSKMNSVPIASPLANAQQYPLTH